MILNKLLKTPYPRPSLSYYLKIAGISGFMVAFMLIVFQPFGTDSFQSDYKYWILGGYGIVIFLAISSYYLFSLKVLNANRESRWTVVKEILDLVICVAFVILCVYVYFIQVLNSSYRFNHFIYFLGISMSLAALPIMGVMGLLYAQWNNVVRSSIGPETSSDNNVIVLLGNNKSDKLELDQSDLLLVKAQDNYVMLYIRDKDKRHILRSTLKEISSQLNADFLKVHRSYIINKTKVEKLVGNKSKSHVLLHDLKTKIPVSRNIFDQVKSL